MDQKAEKIATSSDASGNVTESALLQIRRAAETSGSDEPSAF